MSHAALLKRAITKPPHRLVPAGIRYLRRRSEAARRRRRDLSISTYGPAPEGVLASYMELPPVSMLAARADALSGVAAQYLSHRFDLLGSGWFRPLHGVRCRGLGGFSFALGSGVEANSSGVWLEGRINDANLSRAQAVWRLVGEGYQPIDWQLDFKSGFRWSELTWYLDIQYGEEPGADVKVPWELARMQHLPQLAWAYVLANAGRQGLEPPQRYANEFRNQVLDFIANNPPRFGVNWSCTMDVAIRIANWLVAYDMFVLAGADLDSEFKAVLAASVRDHARHIVDNLEWSKQLRANHYLADIVGLLFASAYLPRTQECDTWLAFAVQELVNEYRDQFGLDGAGFEGSTAYHRLSAEMVGYATALVMGLPDDRREAFSDYDCALFSANGPSLRPAPLRQFPRRKGETSPLPSWYVDRLFKTSAFMSDIAKPSGEMPQFGDNDSGRFLKLWPTHIRMSVRDAVEKYAHLEGYDELGQDEDFWDEQHLEATDTAAAINGLFANADLPGPTPETAIVEALAGGPVFAGYRADKVIGPATVRTGEADDWQVLWDLGADGLETFIDAPGEDLTKGMVVYAYPYFGLYGYRSERLYLALRCGPVGQNGNGGHGHNDQLAFECTLDGEELVRDPGTNLYTPLPGQRNAYRSITAHYSPQVLGVEPGALDQGLFQLAEAGAQCLYFGENGFVGRYRLGRAWVWRALAVEVDGFRVRDWADGGFDIHLPRKAMRVSPGYGKLYRHEYSIAGQLLSGQ